MPNQPEFFRDLVVAIKKNKIPYYAINYFRQIIPTTFYTGRLKQKLQAIDTHPNKAALLKRVGYHNKLETLTHLGENATYLKDLKISGRLKTYKFDAFEYLRYFNKNLRANFLFGDVNHVANEPALQKSRPIVSDDANAVILKLDKKRHFFFVNDDIPFADKKNMLIGRGVMSQPHRMRFMEMYFGHPMCDLGQVNSKGGNPQWIKPKISLGDHLKYKFILCIEGHDVATNLKWVMSSNSIAVMPKPTHETWFMEGTLIPNHHYILIKDDYSDLEERLQYYIQHQDEALTIIQNANAHCQQFQNKVDEDLISLLVLEKYFYYTSQMGK